MTNYQVCKHTIVAPLSLLIVKTTLLGSQLAWAEQDFLFLIEEAYSQEADEWQWALQLTQSRYRLDAASSDSKDRIGIINVEYGITERWQLELELPYQRSKITDEDGSDTVSAIGNLELGASYLLFGEEDEGAAVRVGSSLSAAAGSEKEPVRSDEWGVEVFSSASKELLGGHFLHVSISYEREDQGDETELSYGIAYVLPLSSSWSTLLEIQKHHADEQEPDGEEESSSYHVYSLGLSYESQWGPQIGISYGKGSDDELMDTIAQFKIQYEH